MFCMYFSLSIGKGYGSISINVNILDSSICKNSFFCSIHKYTFDCLILESYHFSAIGKMLLSLTTGKNNKFLSVRIESNKHKIKHKQRNSNPYYKKRMIFSESRNSEHSILGGIFALRFRGVVHTRHSS